MKYNWKLSKNKELRSGFLTLFLVDSYFLLSPSSWGCLLRQLCKGLIGVAMLAASLEIYQVKPPDCPED